MITEITKCSKVTKVILFGSRAKGNFRDGSDIDLALFGDGIDSNDIAKIAISADELLFPYKIDLIIYDRITVPELKNHIIRVGIELFKSSVVSWMGL